MGTNRLEALRGMLEQDPKSTFARYGLAIELVNQGDSEEAQKEFDTLLSQSPEYIAGYLHSGRNLEKLGQIEQAKTIYRTGIEYATRAGDGHSCGELKAALEMAEI